MMSFDQVKLKGLDLCKCMVRTQNSYENQQETLYRLFIESEFYVVSNHSNKNTRN